MKVGIDARSLRSGPAGVATYVGNLLRRIDILDGISTSFPRNNLLWNLLRVPLEQVRRGWDLYHGPGYTAPPVSFRPVLLSVHDVSYLSRPEFYPYRLDPLRKAFYLRSIRRADRILVPSRFTADELQAAVPEVRERVAVIPLGVSEEFYPDPQMARQVRRKYDLPDRFVLHVGDIHPRRNCDRILQASRRLGLDVIFVGKLLTPGILPPDEAKILTGLDEADLRGLYSAAALLACASEYEGFGLPIVEAMACGLPVVAANRSCIPEVSGGAALLVEPEVDALAQGFERAIRDPESFREAGRIRARDLSWESTAQRTFQCYQQLMSLRS